jgi:uncharacterized protein
VTTINLPDAKTIGRAAAVMAIVLSLTVPVLADDAPVCAGRDLGILAAQRPEALARAKETRRDQLDNAQGLLWRIEKSGIAPSYLFGTVHSTDERAVALAKKAAAHIAGAKIVATELGGPFDAVTMAAMGTTIAFKAMAHDEDTLAPLGSPEDIALVEKFLAARGIAGGVAHHLRIWFLATATAAPICELTRQQRALPVVDETIAQTAKGLGVKVIGLETIAEQTDLLTTLDPKTAQTVLLSSARKPAVSDDSYATLIDLYLEERPGDILPIIDASQILTPQESAAEDDMTRHLLGARNKIMVERMTPLLEAGGAFVAVGALHLIGKGGLVALLRAAGYSVTAAH